MKFIFLMNVEEIASFSSRSATSRRKFSIYIENRQTQWTALVIHKDNFNQKLSDSLTILPWHLSMNFIVFMFEVVSVFGENYAGIWNVKRCVVKQHQVTLRFYGSESESEAECVCKQWSVKDLGCLIMCCFLLLPLSTLDLLPNWKF